MRKNQNKGINFSPTTEMSNNDKIKCYELDFGDTNVISEDVQVILDWIKGDILDLENRVDNIEYTISIKWMTQEEYEALPDWA